MDVPVGHDDRVYVTSKAALDGLAAAYAQHSKSRGLPAILATPRSANEFAEAPT